GKAFVVELAVVAVLAGGAFRLVRDGGARIAPVRERHAHRLERGLVFSAQLLRVERVDALRERRVAVLLLRVPGRAVAALEFGPEAGVDRANRVTGVEEVEENRLGGRERARLGRLRSMNRAETQNEGRHSPHSPTSRLAVQGYQVGVRVSGACDQAAQ